MHGRVVAGDPDVEPSGFSIDSRSIAPGHAFFAIVAARDGHEFAPEAVARGARVVVASRDLDLPTLAPAAVVRVAETIRALQELGRVVRRESRAKVVAITGSAGKTTTKETIAALLEGTFTVVKNPGNLNNHLGLPLSLLELRHGADVAVMELGMNHPGEIRVLVGLAEPDIRVWTNVGDAHIGNFGTADALAAAKAEILEGAAREALLVANADDPRVMRYAAGFAGRVVTFGYGEGADVRAVEVKELGLAGMRAIVRTRSAEAAVTVPLLGRGNLSNVLCATAVATEMGVPLTEVAKRIARLAPAKRRGEVRHLRAGRDRRGRQLQLESLGAQDVARDAGKRAGGRPSGRGARRDAGAGRSCDDIARGLRAECGGSRPRPADHGRWRARAGIGPVGGGGRPGFCRWCDISPPAPRPRTWWPCWLAKETWCW